MERKRNSKVDYMIESSILKMDLKYVKELKDLKESIDKGVDEKLKMCQNRHEQSRRWTIGTWISIIGPIIALISVFITLSR